MTNQTTINQRHIEKFKTVLNDFAQRGNRFALAPKLSWWARFIGMPLEDLLDEVHTIGVTNRDNDLIRLYQNAVIKNDWQYNNQYQYHGIPKTEKPKPKQYPQYVHDLIAENANIKGGIDLLALSPYRVDNLHGIHASKTMLAHLFDDDELVCVGTMDKGVYPQNLKPLKDWLKGEAIGDYTQVKINTFSGECEMKSDGKPSFFTEKFLTTFRYILLEYDDLTALEQCKIAVGMIKREYEVVAVVFSGNKSLHILLNVNAENLEQWNEEAGIINRLFCGCDDKALRRPSIAIRLGGAIRKDKATEQRLLYLNPVIF